MRLFGALTMPAPLPQALDVIWDGEGDELIRG